MCGISKLKRKDVSTIDTSDNWIMKAVEEEVISDPYEGVPTEMNPDIRKWFNHKKNKINLKKMQRVIGEPVSKKENGSENHIIDNDSEDPYAHLPTEKNPQIRQWFNYKKRMINLKRLRELKSRSEKRF